MENTPIFKKGKNARMGKGKGIFQRLTYRVKKNQIILEFFNMNCIVNIICVDLETFSHCKI